MEYWMSAIRLRLNMDKCAGTRYHVSTLNDSNPSLYSFIQLNNVTFIGVIYEGYRYPSIFGLMGTVPSLFRTKLGEEFVNRCNLRRLNYYKIVFSRDSAPDPAGTTHNAIPDLIVG